MKRITLLVWVSLFCEAVASAQTNCAPSAHDLLVLPEAHLRALPESPGPASPNVVADAASSAPRVAHLPSAASDDSQSFPAQTGRTSLSAGRLSAQIDDFDPDAFHQLQQSGFFERRETGPPTGFAKCVDAIFRPEVIHLGHGQAAITCSLYTAIKRKNPLCLLNPLFFNLSW